MNVKTILLNRLSVAQGEFVSGAELSRQLGVSRNAVWKAVKSLEADGYKIDSEKTRGYRLSADNSCLSAEIIRAENKSERLGSDIIVLSETESTNNYAKDIASKGAVHGTVVLADKQTAGKGRLGRKFESPSGKGIYMSVIIRPSFDVSFAPMITSAAAVAAAEAVENISGHRTDVKWVNDLYISGKKICGILTEASLNLEMNMLDYAVIGIGVNVLDWEFPDELKDRASSIEAETGVKADRNRLCAEILCRLEYYLDRIESRSHLDEYRRREILTGNRITASFGNETITAKAAGIDDNANLVVILDDGTEKKLTSGEANLCRIIK